MSHNLYPELVKLKEDTHQYFHDNGDEYVSFSKLYDEFLCEPFRQSAAAYGVAKSKGITAQEVIDGWAAQRDEGSRIDAALTLYADTGLITDENQDIADAVKEIAKEYDQYHKQFGQLVLYHEKYKVAGSSDKICLKSNKKDSVFITSDYKCFEKEIDFMPSSSPRFLKAPFDYLPNTKYTKICFQLSYYSHLFEELTGRKCIRQFIHWIRPSTTKNGMTLEHKLIPAMYMKADVQLFLETYKEKILTLTQPAGQPLF